MDHCGTLKILCALGLVLLSLTAGPTSAQSQGYDELLQKIRDGQAPKIANYSEPDWVYSSQTSAFEKALKKGKILGM